MRRYIDEYYEIPENNGFHRTQMKLNKLFLENIMQEFL